MGRQEAEPRKEHHTASLGRREPVRVVLAWINCEVNGEHLNQRRTYTHESSYSSYKLPARLELT